MHWPGADIFRHRSRGIRELEDPFSSPFELGQKPCAKSLLLRIIVANASFQFLGSFRKDAKTRHLKPDLISAITSLTDRD